MSYEFKARAGKFGRNLLAGLETIGTALADGPKYARIIEIDKLIADLQQERDHTIAGLIEPGEYVVSENYDPSWSKPASAPNISSDTADGRLTACKGEYKDTVHNSHPACPYKDTVHNSHEFTLRD